MNAETIHDLIIVGGGPGGYTAGIYAMRAALDTVLIEKAIAGGQLNNTDIVENWPGTEKISGPDLALNLARHGEVYGLPVRNGEVVEVEPGLDTHAVRLADGTVLCAHAVILATGGSPRQLGIPGENEYYGKGVSYCAVCDGFFFREKTVIVVGGGDAALEEALYLAKIAAKVYVAHRRESFRAGMILQKRIRAEAKIAVLLNTVLTAIQADGQGVNRVTFMDTGTGAARDLAVDGVFIFIGFAPNNRLVPAGTTLDTNGYVITDARCATSIPGLFAVGDLREKYARQIVTAAGDGCTAALAAAHYVEGRKAGLRQP